MASACAVSLMLAANAGASAQVSTTASQTAALVAGTDSLMGGAASASSLNVQDVCGSPAPGQNACAAQILVSKSSDRPVQPLVDAASSPDRTQTSAAPAVSSVSTPSSGIVQTGAGEPQEGSPAWLQQVYDLSYLSQTKGSGDTVGIVDVSNDPTAESDLATYRSRFGLPACSTANGCFKRVNETGGSTFPPSNTLWDLEISLDLDSVSALCPNCRIVLVEASSNASSDLAQAIREAVALGANQVSNSYAGWSNAYFNALSFPKVALVAAAGDNGAWPSPYAAYPASLENFTAAGGTTILPDTQTARGFTETAWGSASGGDGTGSGCDPTEAKPSWQHDKGCAGRTSTDISANADPSSGILIYDSQNYEGLVGWFPCGGTSESSPLIAAYYALMGAQSSATAPPQWDYVNAASMNDPATGSTGSCGTYICNAGVGYDGPTGVGSISGAVAAAAPGVGGPTSISGNYQVSVSNTSAQLQGGVYPNGLASSYYWRYGTTSAYGSQSTAVSVAQGTAPVSFSSTLTGLTPGTTYHYQLVAKNADGTSYGYDFTLSTTTSTPVSSTPPAITGTVMQGHLLSVSTGTWNPAGSYTYQWQRNTGSGFANIAGATAQTYTPTGADLGAKLDVVVDASNTAGSANASSAAVGPVVSGAPVSTVVPTLSGTPARGSTLSVNPGTWSPAASYYAYQWQRNTGSGFAIIAGQSAASYVLAPADRAATVRVSVTAINAYGQASQSTSAVGPVLSSPPVNTTAPSVSGQAVRGQTLSATAGNWTGAGNTYAYQWKDCNAAGQSCGAINGATGTSYALVLSDEGHTVALVVTATNPDGTASALSKATALAAASPPLLTHTVAVSGTAKQGQVLSAAGYSFTLPTGSTVTYQWERCNAAGHSCVAIAGATGASYTLASADVGSTTVVIVSASNVDKTVSTTSSATAVVAH